MQISRLNLGNKNLNRELEVAGVLFVLFAVLGIGIYIGFSSLNLDTRNEAAGKTIYLENGGDLQAALDSASNNDAIYLKPGSYISKSESGFKVSGKNIRVLGSGEDYSTIVGNNKENGFSVESGSVSIESLKITGAQKDGLSLKGTSGEIKINDVTISGNSGNGLNSFTKTTINNSLIDQNGIGFTANGPLVMTNTVIKNSAKNGLNLVNSQNSTISNSIFSSNLGTGISLTNSKVAVKNVTVVNNESGLVENDTASETTITNSIIQGSKTAGIVLKGSKSSVTYSNIFSNGSSNFSPAGLAEGTGNISADSKFKSTSEFQLSDASTLKNKGNPTETNANGSRVDMGAYGGNPNLRNANAIPEVTSKPNEFIKVGQTYSYEIIAKDADGDKLEYIILNKDVFPSWLKQEDNKFIGTPKTGDIGNYGILVVVTDRKGGNTVHPISINVLPDERAVPTSVPTTSPTATTAPTSTVVPTQQPQKPTPIVAITTPKAGDVLNSEKNEIRWTLTNGQNVESIELKYSTDGSEYKPITKLPGSTTNYKWEGIKDIPNGKYYIKIEATDNSTPAVKVAALSPQFEVKNEVAGRITIVKRNPSDEVVNNRRVQIYIEFSPASEVDKSKTYLKANGQELPYTTTQSSISYEPTTDFTGNNLRIEAQIFSTNGSESEAVVWVVAFTESANPNNTAQTTTNERTINIFGLKVNYWLGLILIGLLVLTVILGILYLVFYMIKRIREQREGNLDNDFTEYYDQVSYNNEQPTYTNTPDYTQTENVEQYYQAEQTPQEPQNPSLQEYASTEDQQQIDPNQAQYQDQISQQQYTYDNKAQFTNDQTTLPQGQKYQTTDTQVVDTTQNVSQDTSGYNQQLQALKAKYNVEEGNVQTGNEVIYDQNTVQDPNQQFVQPDPNQASTPPQNK